MKTIVDPLAEVFVIGGSHQNALGVLRALGRKGIRPFFILVGNKKKASICRSRYIKRWVIKEFDEVVPFLLEQKKGWKQVIIACHDRIVEILDESKEVLNPFYIIPGSSKISIKELMNKQIMTETAIKNGFTVPRSYLVTSGVTNLDDIPFPCITKPVLSTAGTKHEIVVCQNLDELSEFLKKNPGHTYQIQKFIDVNFEFQLIGASCFQGEKIIIPGVSEILHPYNGSNTHFLHYRQLTEDFKSTLSLTFKYIKEIGYSGLFSVEFLRGKDGHDYFLEMNFRNDGNTISVTNAGANLPYWWVMTSTGHDLNDPEIDHEEFVMPEYNELKLWKHGVITTEEFFTDLKKTTSFTKYASDDKWPTYGKTVFYVKFLLTSIGRLLK